MLESEAQVVRRVEVIAGTGRRRRFSDDDKARMIEETLAPGAVVSEIARWHGLTPQQLFGWRRQARQSTSSDIDKAGPVFVPAVVNAPVSAPTARSRGTKRARRGDGDIGVTIDGVTVRVGRGADAKTIAAVTHFIEDGRIDIDSNVVERSIRPIALNRKNALFAGSEDGAEHWAVIASLIETCKLNAVDPQHYLTDIITRSSIAIPTARSTIFYPGPIPPLPSSATWPDNTAYAHEAGRGDTESGHPSLQDSRWTAAHRRGLCPMAMC
jgi:transposase